MGAEVTARDKKGYTPLHFAAGQGRLDIVKFLWSKAAETEAEDPGGHPFLAMLAQPVANFTLSDAKSTSLSCAFTSGRDWRCW